MKFYPYVYRVFEKTQSLPASEEHRNELDIVVLEGKEGAWYSKKMSTPQKAVKNLLSADLFRLISTQPHPQTLVAKNEENQWYVLSEDFSTTHATAKSDDLMSHPGFAEVLVVSIWLHEVDLRLPNLLVNQTTGSIAKIDGEVSFCSLQFAQHEHEIDVMTFKRLPYPHRYPTFNWLSHIENNLTLEIRDFHYPDMSVESFEQEKNQAMLRICLLPDIFISALCKTVLFTPEDDDYALFLIDRRDQIRAVARISESFNTYLQSEEAKRHTEVFLTQLLGFTTQRVSVVTPMKTRSLSDEYYGYARQLGLVSSPSFDKENHCISTHSIFAESYTRHAAREMGRVMLTGPVFADSFNC